MTASTRFEFQFGNAPPPASPRRRGVGPLRIVLLGDFSGRAARAGGGDASTALGERRPLRVDVDTLDAVLGRLAPQLALPDRQASSGEMAFATIDDFRPDALFSRLPVFAQLRELRMRLRDPNTFAGAAAELMNGAPAVPEPAAAAPADDPSSLLGGLLGMPAAAAPAATAPRPATGDAVQALIRHIVAPHIVREAMPRQAEYLAAVDAAITDQMRAVLQAPAFQALESAWRGVQRLVSTLELDDDLQLWLFDASADELRADIAAAGAELQRSGLHRALVARSGQLPGLGDEAQPWSLLAGLYGFDASAGSVALLAALGAIAAQCGAPFIGSARPALAGCASFAGAVDPSDWAPPQGDAALHWQALRQSTLAPWLGLVAPRWLLRLPYGASTDEVDAFAFEEFSGPPAHEQYLWGDGSLAAALLIGQAFMQSGWAMNPGDVQELADLPAHVVLRDGEKQLQPVAEAWLSERAVQRLLDQGVMALVSHRGRDAARLPRFHSIAQPARRLAFAGEPASP